MATWVASVDPWSGEHDSYDRIDDPVEYTSLVPIRTVWKAVSAARAQMWVRDANDVPVPYGPWVDNVGGYYVLFVPMTACHNVMEPRLEGLLGSGTLVRSVSYVNNPGTTPLPDQCPYHAITRLEAEHQPLADGTPNNPPAKRITPPSKSWRPYNAKVKDRTGVVTSWVDAQLWSRAVWAEDFTWALRAELKKTTKGDWVVAKEQKYPYYAAVKFGTYTPGTDKPTCMVRDGPRMFARQGYISQILIRDNMSGFLFVETNSRIAFTHFKDIVVPPGTDMRLMHAAAGHTDTLIGWVWDHDTEQWTYRGDFSRTGVTRLIEPWQVSIARRMPDGSVNTRSGFTLWVCDPVQQVVLAFDIYPGHPQIEVHLGRLIPPDFMPAGYVRPATATQPVGVRVFGTPNVVSPLINGCWGNAFRVKDEKLYITNFEGGSIVRGNPDGTGLEMVLQGDKTFAQLGISSRINPSIKTVAELRSYVRDGPLATASCIAPQFIHEDPVDGTLVFVERHTWLVRRLDPEAGTVVSFEPIPEGGLSGSMPSSWTHIVNGVNVVTPSVVLLGGSSSSGTQDMTMWIDDGPAREVFVNAWGTHYHWSKDGKYLGVFTGPITVRYLTNGPAELTRVPTYRWGGDSHTVDGKSLMLLAGNDGGSSFLELTKRQPTDVVPTVAQQAAILRGRGVWNKCFYLTHGVDGYGCLGYPNVEEFGSWTDAGITAYLLTWGGTAADVSDFIAYVRHRTQDFDYTTITLPPPDVTPPGAPESFSVVSTNWSGTMYNVVLRMKAPDTPMDQDITAARLYADGVAIVDVPCLHGQQVEYTLQHPGGGSPVVYGCAFIDDETPALVGPRVTINSQIPPPPDVYAPSAPALFVVASITWVP